MSIVARMQYFIIQYVVDESCVRVLRSVAVVVHVVVVTRGNRSMVAVAAAAILQV